MQAVCHDNPETYAGISGPVVVAMSGGVDSCAAALLLRNAGLDVIGISMQVWDYRKNNGNPKRATCCAPSDFDDARTVAAAAQFPFYVFDFEDSFHDAVIAPFVRAYLQGQTPNPCLDCNRKVKFRELRRRAAGLGASTVATGHYARIGRRGEQYVLYTARDEQKDQSYFLYAMTQDDLRSTLFPVGEMTKAEVRAYLAEQRLTVARKEESQDICFVSGEVAEFIERNGGERRSGVVRNRAGEALGTHDGIHRFTVGQRKGLGLAAASPLYVLDIDAATNEITVGSREELSSAGFFVEDTTWVSGEPPPPGSEVLVKLRYRHGGVRCRLTPTAQGVRGEFLGEWSAVSPGQAAVFYSLETTADGAREVLGGGIISGRDDGHGAA